MQDFVLTALSVHMPNVLRWAGGLARLLRKHNIGLEGKGTGSAGTDALTLADLSLQELIVSALRDSDPIFRHCRIDAEETTGDLAAFPQDAPLTIGIDPIDGTRKYRDHAGNGYSVMLHLRSPESVLYSLVFIPEQGTHGWWVEARDGGIVSGPDDPTRPAGDVLRSLPRRIGFQPVEAIGRLTGRTPEGENTEATPRRIFVNGFRHRDPEAAQRVTEAGLMGVTSEQLPGCPYELLASGWLHGALLHSPNVYDFPVTSHLSQLLGGSSVYVRTAEDIQYRDLWLDPIAKMLRLRGLVACGTEPGDVKTLCSLARDWQPDRYHDGVGL